MTDDTDVSWIRCTHNLIPASQVQLLRFNVCWLVKDYQMCPLFKICLVASILSRGAVIHNQKWTRKTNHVSEPLCRHYRNDVTYGHQERGTLTLFFYTKKVLYVHTWHSNYDLTTTRSLKPILHMRRTIDLIKLFSHDSHYQFKMIFASENGEYCFHQFTLAVLHIR